MQAEMEVRTISPEAFVGDFSTTWRMATVRLMGTIQRCTTCGTTRKGSVASEAYVVCQHIKEPDKIMPVKLEEILSRYAAHTGLTREIILEKYFPAMSTTVQWAVVDIPLCEKCLPAIGRKREASLPPMMPLSQGAARAASWPTSGNIDETGAVKSLQASAKTSRKAKPKPKPTLKSFFNGIS